MLVLLCLLLRGHGFACGGDGCFNGLSCGSEQLKHSSRKEEGLASSRCFPAKNDFLMFDRYIYVYIYTYILTIPT